MDLSEFHYQLPDELIAHYPQPERSASRLLCLKGNSGAISHQSFKDLVDQVNPEDLLVFNNTRVIPARVFAKKETGGQVELLLERVTGLTTALSQIRASKSPKPGAKLFVTDEVFFVVTGRQGSFFEVEVGSGQDLQELLAEHGHMPLPPYIERADEVSDWERYQTVFAKQPGAVAAPTAGLHFDDELLQQLRDKGADMAYVTLHVGAGTFQPVRVDTIEEHQMHKEYLEVSPEVCEQVAECRARGGRVIAVGTTSVRCLETATNDDGVLEPFRGDTQIFIYPGYRFKCVDALVTNFHLPESTLLMLVSAFSGKAHIMNAYAEAIAERYRFFSYGDAMFLIKQDFDQENVND